MNLSPLSYFTLGNPLDKVSHYVFPQRNLAFPSVDMANMYESEQNIQQIMMPHFYCFYGHEIANECSWQNEDCKKDQKRSKPIAMFNIKDGDCSFDELKQQKCVYRQKDNTIKTETHNSCANISIPSIHNCNSAVVSPCKEINQIGAYNYGHQIPGLKLPSVFVSKISSIPQELVLPNQHNEYDSTPFIKPNYILNRKEIEITNFHRFPHQNPWKKRIPELFINCDCSTKPQKSSMASRNLFGSCCKIKRKKSSPKRSLYKFDASKLMNSEAAKRKSFYDKVLKYTTDFDLFNPPIFS
eukprot:TRINITY_DN1173_c0_g1_i1.p1 TRINITY_DN1173_c0_g1~~TRINITY_DN1173_c0_g1_i1.p1  ORF type:complete len:298 (+),score=54.87 TRINITY_DN1173_c0_g1_i1:61-954(+)